MGVERPLEGVESLDPNVAKAHVVESIKSTENENTSGSLADHNLLHRPTLFSPRQDRRREGR
jgi:hypothetical protein